MRALFFALAALSLFAVMTAYTEDMSNSMEDLSWGYGLENATEAVYKDCMGMCTDIKLSASTCDCVCKKYKGKINIKSICKRGCSCVGLFEGLCDDACNHLWRVMIRSLGMDLGGDPVKINWFLFFYSWNRVGFVVGNKTNGGKENRNERGKMECRAQSMHWGEDGA